MFQFKQFNVDQSGCAMKINTDGVLLGALAGSGESQNILDIGTGTGVIALMLAQRFATAKIDAVEIDETAAQTAKRNFSNSPFSNRLTLYSDSFQDYLETHPEKKYDLIVSNPPFFLNSLKPQKADKAVAKHADADFFETLIRGISKHFTGQGSCWLILPPEIAILIKEMLATYNLFLNEVINIYSYQHSKAHREITVLSLTQTSTIQKRFVIYDALKEYTAAYTTALADFFTIF